MQTGNYSMQTGNGFVLKQVMTRLHFMIPYDRSHLFLEYKLCKLLLRKLSDTSRVQPSRLELRGYSRLSTPLMPPESPEQWEDSPVDCTSQASWPGKVQERHYHRPLGSASSLPAMLSFALETRLKLLEGPPDKKMSNGDDYGGQMEQNQLRKLWTIISRHIQWISPV